MTMASLTTTHLSSVIDTKLVSEVVEVAKNNESTDHFPSTINDVTVPNDENEDNEIGSSVKVPPVQYNQIVRVLPTVTNVQPA